ncbi:MAG: biopolymer transporter ExbD [Bacteroidetes bacterium]|nr:biopolymer transporter ExbD [Bacteroidota bacterium]
MADVDLSQSKGKQKHGGKKKRKRINVRVDMTPMVDVAFLLLTFFMLTTSMSKPQTMEINLPPTNQDGKVNDVQVAASNLLTVRVRDDFKVFWNIGEDDPVAVDGSDRKAKLVSLGKLLKERSASNPKLITLIKIDDKAKYIDMVDVMDEMNINGITRFSIAPMAEKDKQEIATL